MNNNDSFQQSFTGKFLPLQSPAIAHEVWLLAPPVLAQLDGPAAAVYSWRMKRLAKSIFLTLLPLTALPAAAQDQHPQWALVERFCLECHNDEDWAGQVAFSLMGPDSLHAEPAVFEAVLRKLSSRLMPPPGAEQPEQANIDAFTAWVEQELDANGALPKAGHVPLRRLNRTEYQRSVRDLLGVAIDAEEFLPTEIEVDGFDNVAEALSVSPAFLAQFIRAARLIAAEAVGSVNAKTAVATYQPSGESQTEHLAGMPPGTRGGIAFTHNFPADGEYRFNLLGLTELNSSALETAHTVVLLVDGSEVFRASIGGPEDFELTERTGAAGVAKVGARFMNIPVSVQAGPHKVVTTFLERSRAQSLYWSDSGTHNRMPRMDSGVEVEGPFNITGVAMTPSREKIFVCYPAANADQAACARQITENLAKRAFGRRITEEDMATLLSFYTTGLEVGGFEKGIEEVVAAVLASPHFLYRGVVPDAGQENDAYFALDDIELASRLSFFLWSQGPDDELLDLAIAGRLSEPAVMEAQVQRMLEDPRVDALVQNFAVKWLNLDDLSDVDPDPRMFPEFNDALMGDFSEEMRRFLASVLLEDRPVTELLTADYTFLNERLARHYGIANVYGAQFRRVALDDATRFGLLGKGAVMMRTSYGDRTSIVLRGNWVLEKLLGSPPPDPPPDVETDLSIKPGERATTMRARMDAHRANPSCNQCHGVIDPIGLALENFSVTGRWRDRDTEANEPIDASALMPGGIPVNGPLDLRDQLMDRPEKFVRTFTAKMMMYGLARELEYFDMPQVRAIVANAAENDYHLFDLVMGMVNSDSFRYQAREDAAESATVASRED